MKGERDQRELCINWQEDEEWTTESKWIRRAVRT